MNDLHSGTAHQVHDMPFGAHVLPDGRVRFRIWAPGCERIALAFEGSERRFPLNALDDGWHELTTAEARAGSRYRYVLPDGTAVPDPASRWQPEDVNGPSEVVDPRGYSWRMTTWTARPWHEAVIYELHVGTFTEEGTFGSAIGKLDYLKTLGVTAVEIMPVADFAGRRNWGYDGVLLYAPDSSYGRPEDFKAFVDAAHARGLMVLLDVVYNHFGPEGNYLSLYAADFFTDRHRTPWGAAINYDGEKSRPVREFVIHNALYWIEEFALDGLRLDAVHAIVDDSAKHFLVELAERVRGSRGGREVHLILENERNEAGRLERDDARAKRFTAQWNDDVHHVLHTAVTGERSGYYGDYTGDTAKLGRALAEGFAFQGEVMQWGGEPRGERSAHLPPGAFIAFIQNHDQIGNRAMGERIGALAPPESVRAIAATYLLLPQIPMLFMGEEWGAAEPFLFFCDFRGDLGNAVRKGRRGEFAAFPEFADPEARKRIPDPVADETFRASKLDWTALHRAPHAEVLAWYARILATRHQEIVPLIPAIRRAARYRTFGPGCVVVTWDAGERGWLVLEANLSDRESSVASPSGGRVLWQEGTVAEGRVGPWSLRWTLQASAR